MAEKSAALDVVYRRLHACGLGDAVLELHSNKADRKSILSQLGRSWGRAANPGEAEWIQGGPMICPVTRDQLNAYVAALHAKGSQGFSVFQAIGAAAGQEQPFSVSFANKDAHDAESYTRLRKLAKDLGRCQEIIAGRKPLHLVQADTWSFEWQKRLLERSGDLIVATRALAEAAESLACHAGLTWTGSGEIAEVAPLLRLAAIPESGEDVSWALARDMDEMQAQVEVLKNRLCRTMALRLGRVSARYPMDRLDRIPLYQLNTDWRLAQTKIWPLSVLAKYSVRKRLQTYAEEGKSEPESRNIVGAR